MTCVILRTHVYTFVAKAVTNYYHHHRQPGLIYCRTWLLFASVNQRSLTWWADDIIAIAGRTWLRLAQERCDWHKQREACPILYEINLHADVMSIILWWQGNTLFVILYLLFWITSSLSASFVIFWICKYVFILRWNIVHHLYILSFV